MASRNNNNNNATTCIRSRKQRNGTEQKMNNETHPNAENNTIARELIGARLTDVINDAATRLAADPNHATNINRNLAEPVNVESIEIVRNVLTHAIRTVISIGDAPATLTVAEWYCDEIDEPISKHIETYTFAVIPWPSSMIVRDIACRLVNTANHVISIA